MKIKYPELKKALVAAFPHTLPILAGFLFLGMAYGIYMRVSGFSPLYSFFMSITVFAGSMQFVAVNVLLGPFNPLGSLFLTLMVNARHLFYGLSMLDKYKEIGKKRWYLIFGMCDETFSINCTVDIPEGIDKGYFYFFITLLDQCYWVLGATIGGIFGSLVTFNSEGIEFVMTALLVVIFLEQWLKDKNYVSALLGIGLSLIALIIFGSESFIIPSMLLILGSLILLRGILEKGADNL